MRLSGNVAIINGATRGIGAATAERFCQEGARVLLTDVLDAPGQALAPRLSKGGAQAAYLYLDVADEAAGITNVTEVAMTGYPGTAILEELGEGGDKLAAMGTDGSSGVKRWVLGSVADRVIRHSSGPVLVVRPG
ncbi:MAG: SDR family NAD(P)-dependent oxidoreductase [Chloroflexota bacterium]